MIPFQYVPEIFWRVLSEIQLSWLGIVVLPAVCEPYDTGAGMYGLFPQDLARPPLLILVRKPDFVNVDGEV